MFENDAKGWHGSYSIAGRNSAEKYHIIIHKNEILGGEHKKLRMKDIFTPDEPQPIENLEDNIDIFKVYSNDPKDKITFVPKTQIPPKKEVQKVDRLKYHNQHIKDPTRKKKVFEPPSTFYTPKRDFIWPRTITGPHWKILKGRDRRPRPIDTRGFYIKPTPATDKCFVNMNRQTQRGDFAGSGDVRIRTDKPFVKEAKSASRTATEFLKKSSSNSSYGERTEGGSVRNNTSYDRLRLHSNQKQHIKGPDFKKTISREQVEKIKGPKFALTPYIEPNYSLVRERPLTMAIYDKPSKHKTRTQAFQGMDLSIKYDPDKVITKVNNHVAPNPPDFKLMTSRPEGKGPLPSYMQKLHDRESVYILTEKSLKMNNYKNAKFMTASTCFWPKKSFNRYVNLSLLNSVRFNKKSGAIDDVSDVQKGYLTTSAKFCHQNFEDLIKEGELNRFDNITYKSIKKEHKIDPGDMEKYLLNFDNVDA